MFTKLCLHFGMRLSNVPLGLSLDFCDGFLRFSLNDIDVVLKSFAFAALVLESFSQLFLFSFHLLLPGYFWFGAPKLRAKILHLIFEFFYVKRFVA